MTGYHISIGYNSTLNATERREAFATLKRVVETLRDDTDRLVAEAKREQPHRTDLELQEYADLYRLPARDSTLTICDPLSEDRPGEIMQLASGGGEGRDTKELMRRAFSRLVIFEMHKLCIEVDFVVA